MVKANCKRDKRVDVSIRSLLPARITIRRLLLLLRRKMVPSSLAAVLFPLTLNSSRKDQHAILHLKHPPVEALLHQELVMGAALADPTTIEYQNLIHPLHRDEAMGHHQRRSPPHQHSQRIQHGLLRQGDKVGRRLMK